MYDRHGSWGMWSYGTCFGKSSIHYEYIVFELYEVLRFESTVIINILINIPSPKLNNQIFLLSKLRVHECTSGLTATPKVELFCSCERRKFICQNKVKICKLWSQKFKFLVQKYGCPSHKSRTINAQNIISGDKTRTLYILAILLQAMKSRTICWQNYLLKLEHHPGLKGWGDELRISP